MKHSHQKKVARTFDVRTRVQDARTFDVRTRVQDARTFDVRTRECIRTLHLQYLNERDSFYVYITNA